MKKIFIGIIILFSAIFLFNCISSPASKEKYVMVIDSIFYEPNVSKESWLIYSAKIEEVMKEYYDKNPNGNFIMSFETEMNARRYMMFYYVVNKARNEDSIIDNYLEEVIKINEADLFNEYVFICFHQENWGRNENLKLEEFRDFMMNNLPNHIPLTLIWFERR